MKAEIHPNYQDCQVKCNCGEEFVTRSTRNRIAIEICSKCHPFYTGKNKFVDSEGRVERFQNKFSGNYALQKKVKKPKLEKIPKVIKLKETGPPEKGVRGPAPTKEAAPAATTATPTETTT